MGHERKVLALHTIGPEPTQSKSEIFFSVSITQVCLDLCSSAPAAKLPSMMDAVQLMVISGLQSCKQCKVLCKDSISRSIGRNASSETTNGLSFPTQLHNCGLSNVLSPRPPHDGHSNFMLCQSEFLGKRKLRLPRITNFSQKGEWWLSQRGSNQCGPKWW